MTDGLIVVDECLEYLGRAAYRDVIVVGNGGGNKAGGAFLQQDRVLCAPDSQTTVALQVHDDDERVVLHHVAVEGVGGFYHLDAEERRVQYLMSYIDVIAMLCLVLRIDGMVDGLCCQFGVQLTWLAVESRAVVVVDAVGDVAGLLL